MGHDDPNRSYFTYNSPQSDASRSLHVCTPQQPQIYTLWNYRREALVPAFEAGGAAAQAASDGELALTAACLQVRPQRYSTGVVQGSCFTFGPTAREGTARSTQVRGRALQCAMYTGACQLIARKGTE